MKGRIFMVKCINPDHAQQEVEVANETERADYRPNPLPKRAPHKANDDELKVANERGIRAPREEEHGSSGK